MKIHASKWYETRLREYFEENYGEYEYSAEFYPNPKINQWKFIIQELNIKVLLTCHLTTGEVYESVYELLEYEKRKGTDELWDGYLL